MKKFILLLIAVIGSLVALNAQVQVQSNKSAYLGSLTSSTRDTMTNADTTIYTVSISGAKRTVTWVFDQIKISGTATQNFKIYGSADGGTTYTTYAVDSIVSANNASAVYSLKWTNNPFEKYKVIILSAATQSVSQRTRLLYRD